MTKPADICLSDAIRKGMKLCPIARKSYMSYDDNDNVTACALGTAVIGVVGVKRALLMDRDGELPRMVGELWPYIHTAHTFETDVDLETAVISWNDNEGASRATIAARVAKIEKRLGLDCQHTEEPTK